jgi:tRNA (guanine37-N1)-methyltransferase
VRIDVVTIFPEFFSVLDVSLLGRAREAGVLDIRVHDLRDFTHDRHRTVDDTPYGGGAGMVMRPEPWGEALDAILGLERLAPDSTVIFPTPAGSLFTQGTARDLSRKPHLVFCCGRYEGIDQRVIEHARTRAEVIELSLGDYVLNGGEVAAMAIIEAAGRLVPGVVGNPDSLVEESHEDGLLEYPSYTKPAEWRGFEVPPVLLSGNHGVIAAWRREQQFDRTRRVRPELLPPVGDDLP